MGCGLARPVDRPRRLEPREHLARASVDAPNVALFAFSGPVPELPSTANVPWRKLNLVDML